MINSARCLFAVFIALASAAAAAACNVSVPGLSFGSYDPLATGAPVTTSGTITVSCNDSPPPTVTIAIGPSLGSGGFSPRRMRLVGGSDTLAYNLYVDPAGSQIWGDGQPGTNMPSQKIHKDTPWVMTVYARMPPGQDVTQGFYTDSLLVSINF